MRLYQGGFKLAWIIAALCSVVWGSYGCSVIGPSSISRGRADYNEAIERTESEQMLMAIVRNRYGESFSMLAVTSVTANVSIVADAGVNIGVGPSANYVGNLVPLSGGFSYEENPTISYTPVQGEKYVRDILSPVPLELLILFSRSSTESGLAFTMLVSRVNEMRNPDFRPEPSAEPDPRFTRFVELIIELGKSGHLNWAEGTQENEFAVVIRGYAPTYLMEVREFLTLLGLQMPADKASQIILPISFALKAKKVGGIAITSRSTHDLIQILSASIDVPEKHVNLGLALTYPPTGLVGRNISIRGSEERPQTASVAVKYRGSWFYIDEADQSTKQLFRLVKTIWTVRIANATKHVQAAPLLTLPASR